MTTHVSAVDAERMLSIVDNDELQHVAEDGRFRLAAAADRVVSCDHRRVNHPRKGEPR